MKKIAIVTPVKDEIGNLPKLIAAIESQSIRIYLWVIVENDSTDGSDEYLNKINKIKNVENFNVINLKFENKEYQLGIKYATIIKHGFDYIHASHFFDNIDFISILDADCIPEPDYYKVIMREFSNDKKAGIIGGSGIFSKERISKFSKTDPLGAAMVFDKNCLDAVGYRVVPLSASYVKTKARILGFNVKATSETYFTTRKMGVNVNKYYYGSSAYYLGIPLYHAFLHTVRSLLYAKYRHAYGYLIGYLISYIKNGERVDDQDIIKYNKNRILNKRHIRFGSNTNEN